MARQRAMRSRSEPWCMPLTMPAVAMRQMRRRALVLTRTPRRTPRAMRCVAMRPAAVRNTFSARRKMILRKSPVQRRKPAAIRRFAAAYASRTSGQRQARSGNASTASQNHAASAINQPWIAAVTASTGLRSWMAGGATKRMREVCGRAGVGRIDFGRGVDGVGVSGAGRGIARSAIPLHQLLPSASQASSD